MRLQMKKTPYLPYCHPAFLQWHSPQRPTPSDIRRNIDYRSNRLIQPKLDQRIPHVQSLLHFHALAPVIHIQFLERVPGEFVLDVLLPKVVWGSGEQSVEEKSWDIGRWRRREILSNEERAESKDGGLECCSNDWWDHLDGDVCRGKMVLRVERAKESGGLE